LSKRSIDLRRCLVRDGKVSCHRCAEICPQKAITDHVIDMERCDGCGLCSAVCPAAAITASEDYAGALAKAEKLQPKVLMCEKAGAEGAPCLGFLNRRLLWAMAYDRGLCLDISQCQSCRPAVYDWLLQEIDACDEALQESGRPKIRLVHVKKGAEPKKPVKKVERRNFFSALFHSTTEGLQEIAAAQMEHAYVFDEADWLKQRQMEPNHLFYSLEIQAGCTACGLCAVVCPTQALTMERGIGTAKAKGSLHFQPLACTDCGLCTAHCPVRVISVLPHFTGKRQFELGS
jgi:formate hydrogenlyase subunit 6/NADH:ubiquinone oxidoreductase subunit I